MNLLCCLKDPINIPSIDTTAKAETLANRLFCINDPCEFINNDTNMSSNGLNRNSLSSKIPASE